MQETEMRRHEVQFTKAEAERAEQIRRAVVAQGRVRFTDHCRQAARADGAIARHIVESIQHGRIVELSCSGREWRIVTRLEVGRVAHCAVVSEDGVAVTYWQNRAGDRHSTLDLSKYAARAIA